jgi:hypothetical protein
MFDFMAEHVDQNNQSGLAPWRRTCMRALLFEPLFRLRLIQRSATSPEQGTCRPARHLACPATVSVAICSTGRLLGSPADRRLAAAKHLTKHLTLAAQAASMPCGTVDFGGS